MNESLRAAVDKLAPLADAAGRIPNIEAVTLIGSRTAGRAEASSDYDVFVYLRDSEPDSARVAREALADAVAAPEPPRIVYDPPNRADVWMLRNTDALLDVQFWSTAWAQDELDWRLVKHAPQLGYSTAFWRVIRDGYPLVERTGWHPDLQTRARTPYPNELREAIIEMNWSAVGRSHPFSFFEIAATALRRGDAVHAQHRMSKWLACYFDIVFALNRILHPGEKRLVEIAQSECAHLPDRFASDVNDAVRSAATTNDAAIDAMQRMITRLEPMLRNGQ